MNEWETQLFENESVVKYVRLSDGTYRFCHILADHDRQVRNGETATAAGFIYHQRSKFRIRTDGDGRSRTLRLGPEPAVDGHAIAAYLGYEYLGELTR